MLFLVPDITPDDKFIDSYRGDEISPGPKRLLFVQSMGSLNFFLHPGRRFAFYYLHGVGNAVPGIAQEAEMDMVSLDVQFQDFPVFPLADGFKYPSQFTFHLLCHEDFSPIFRGPDQMVLQVIEAM